MDQLPGEAAPSMAPVPSVMGSASARSAARMAARAQQVEESHGNLMASILQRNRMQLARTEDEEDRTGAPGAMSLAQWVGALLHVAVRAFPMFTKLGARLTFLLQNVVLPKARPMMADKAAPWLWACKQQ